MLDLIKDTQKKLRASRKNRSANSLAWLKRKIAPKAIKIADNKGIIIEVNAETDFVARNENFQKFCDELALTGLKNGAENVESLLTH